MYIVNTPVDLLKVPFKCSTCIVYLQDILFVTINLA